VQVIVDVFCSLAFAKVYNSKMPITACDLLYDRVLPFYEELGIEVGSVLTDNGREFCGREDKHPFELLLAMEGIEHRRTKVRTPRTNGFVERMNRTLLDECFRIAGRTTWYTDISEIQRDLDIFMEKYNLRRSHPGVQTQGQNPSSGTPRGPRHRRASTARLHCGKGGNSGRKSAGRVVAAPEARCRGITRLVQAEKCA
jgi:transposase InsO family protein